MGLISLYICIIYKFVEDFKETNGNFECLEISNVAKSRFCANEEIYFSQKDREVSQRTEHRRVYRKIESAS